MPAPVEAFEEYALALCEAHISKEDKMVVPPPANATLEPCGICHLPAYAFVYCRSYQQGTVRPEIVEKL